MPGIQVFPLALSGARDTQKTPAKDHQPFHMLVHLTEKLDLPALYSDPCFPLEAVAGTSSAWLSQHYAQVSPNALISVR